MYETKHIISTLIFTSGLLCPQKHGALSPLSLFVITYWVQLELSTCAWMWRSSTQVWKTYQWPHPSMKSDFQFVFFENFCTWIQCILILSTLLHLLHELSNSLPTQLVLTWCHIIDSLLSANNAGHMWMGIEIFTEE